MTAQQRRQEALSNNITNALTPGYKQDQSTLRAFPEMMMQRIEGNTPSRIQNKNIPMNARMGAINTGVYMQEAVPDFSQGSLKETGIDTDLALVNDRLPDETGALFFTVQQQNGEQGYTRNGNFTVDSEGMLVTNDGNYVLDQEGNPIFTDGLDFNVTSEGNLQVQDQTIPLGIAYSPDANDLVKQGSGIFQLAEDGQAPINAREQGIDYKIQQGYLENSNVDSNQAMTDMMQAYRLFETNQRVVKAYDQSLDKAVNEIARLR